MSAKGTKSQNLEVGALRASRFLVMSISFPWSVFSLFCFPVANIFPIWTDSLTLTFRAHSPYLTLGQDQKQKQQSIQDWSRSLHIKFIGDHWFLSFSLKSKEHLSSSNCGGHWWPGQLFSSLCTQSLFLQHLVCCELRCQNKQVHLSIEPFFFCGKRKSQEAGRVCWGSCWNIAVAAFPPQSFPHLLLPHQHLTLLRKNSPSSPISCSPWPPTGWIKTRIICGTK